MVSVFTSWITMIKNKSGAYSARFMDNMVAAEKEIIEGLQFQKVPFEL